VLKRRLFVQYCRVDWETERALLENPSRAWYYRYFCIISWTCASDSYAHKRPCGFPERAVTLCVCARTAIIVICTDSNPKPHCIVPLVCIVRIGYSSICPVSTVSSSASQNHKPLRAPTRLAHACTLRRRCFQDLPIQCSSKKRIKSLQPHRDLPHPAGTPAPTPRQTHPPARSPRSSSSPKDPSTQSCRHHLLASHHSL